VRLLKPIGKGAQVVGDRLLDNVRKAAAQLPRYSELAATFNGHELARKLLLELLSHAHASGSSSVAANRSSAAGKFRGATPTTRGGRPVVANAISVMAT
jgi:hypothetical protein